MRRLREIFGKSKAHRLANAFLIVALIAMILSSTVGVYVFGSDSNTWKMHIEGGKINYEQPDQPSPKKHSAFSMDRNYTLKQFLLEQIMALQNKYPTQEVWNIITETFAKAPGGIVEKFQAVMDAIEKAFCPIPQDIKKFVLEKASQIEDPVPRTDVSVPPPSKPVHEGVSARIMGAGDTNTWTYGGVNNLWSNGNNWSLTTKPAADELIVFDGTSTANCTIDEDTAALRTFSVNSGYSGVISNSASCDVTTTSDITISAGTVTSRTDCVWTCGGNMIKNSGGTISTLVLNLVMGGSGKTMTLPIAIYSLKLLTGASVTNLGNLQIKNGGLTLESGSILSLTAYIDYRYYSGMTFSNLGTISGAGNLYISTYDATDMTWTAGTIAAPVALSNAATSNRAFTLGANTVLGSTLSVTGGATYTCTLSHGSNYQLQVAGLTTLGALGVMTQGTGTWTFSGGLTQSGTSSVFTQGDGGTVNCTTYTQTAGTLTKTTGTYADKFNITTGFSTTGATVTAYKICLSFAGTTTYSSDNQKSWIGFDVTSGTCTWNSGVGTTTIAYNWNISLGAVLSIGSGKTLYALDRAGTTTTNAGTISGAGTFRLYIDGSSLATFSWTVGTTTCNVIIGGGTSQGGLNFIVKYVGNTSFGSAVTIQGDGVNTVTVTPNTTTDTMTITGLLTLAATGVVTQGTGLWTLNGGVTINGTSALFTQGGNVGVTGTTTLTTGTLTGNTSYDWTQNGSFSRASGFTVTASTVNLIMATASATLSTAVQIVTFNNLTFNANTTVTCAAGIGFFSTGNFLIANAVVVTITTVSSAIDWKVGAVNTFSNLGTITGAGCFQIQLDGFDCASFVFGTCTATGIAPYFYHGNVASAARVLTLGANTVTSGSMRIDGGNAVAKTVNVDTAGFSITCTGITITTRGTLTANASPISVSGSWTTTTGTFTCGTSTVTFTGTGSITTTNANAFNLMTINSAGTITQASDFTVNSNFILTTGTLTGSVSYVMTVGGDFTKNGGTANSVTLKMTTDGKSINLNAPTGFIGLYFYGNTALQETVWTSINGIIVDTGKTVTVANGKGLYMTSLSVTFTNLGVIAGTGTGAFQYHFYNNDRTVTFGTITCPVSIFSQTTANGNRICTLGADTTFGSTLNVYSMDSGAIYTTSLIAGASNRLLTVTGLTTLGARGICTQGTGNWMFNGGITINGASAVFTQGGKVWVNGTTTVTLGTLTGNTPTLWNCSGDFIQTGGAITDNKLSLSMWGTSKSLSPSPTGGSGGGTLFVQTLEIYGTITVTESFYAYNGLKIGSGKTLSINIGKTVYIKSYSAEPYSNAGTINGLGVAQFYIRSNPSKTITFGTINCPVQILGLGGSTTNPTIIMGSDTTFGSTLYVYSTDGTHYLMFSHGTNYKLTVTGLCTLGARSNMTQGTGNWMFNGGLTINGASALFTQGGNVWVNGTTTLTTGTLTGNINYWWTCSGSVSIVGTLTTGVLKLDMTGAGTTIAMTVSTHRLNSFKAEASVSGVIDSFNWNITAGNTVTLTGGSNCRAYTLGSAIGGNIWINGSIAGNFIWDIIIYSANKTIRMGAGATITAIVYIDNVATTASYFLNLSSNVAIGNTLRISSTSSGTMTLDTTTSNYALSCTDLTIGTRGAINCRGSTITVSGNLDSTGTSAVWTYGTSILDMTGTTKTIKMSAGQSLFDYTVNGGGSITLASNIVVLHDFNWTSTFSLSTYTLDNSGGNTICATNFVFATAGTFTAGLSLVVAGNWDTSTITFNQGTSLATLFGASKTVKLKAASTFYDLTVSGSYTMSSDIRASRDLTVSGSLAHGTNCLLTITGLTTLTGTLTQGSGAYVFTGGYTQTAGTFVQAAAVNSGAVSATGGALTLGNGLTWTCTNNWDSDGTTLTIGSSSVVLSGAAKTVKLGAAQAFYDVTFSGSYSLASDIAVGHNLIVSGSLAHGTNFILGVTGTTANSGTMTSGTGAWSFTGGYSQTAGLLTQGGAINSGAVVLTGGTVAGNILYIWTCSGSFSTNAAVVITASVMNLVMATDGTALTISAALTLYSLHINGNVLLAGHDVYVTHHLHIAAGKTCTVTPFYLVYTHTDASCSYLNEGTIAGTGYLTIRLVATDLVWIPGTISIAGNLYIQAYMGGGGANPILTLGADLALSVTTEINLYCVGSASLTFDTDGYDVSAGSFYVNEIAFLRINLYFRDSTVTLSGINGGFTLSMIYTNLYAGTSNVILNGAVPSQVIRYVGTSSTFYDLNITGTYATLDTPSVSVLVVGHRLTVTGSFYANYGMTVNGDTYNTGLMTQAHHLTSIWTFTDYYQSGTGSIVMANTINSDDVAISGGSVAGSAGHYWNCAGDFIESGATAFVASVFDLLMSGTGKTLSISAPRTFRSLTISGDTAFIPGQTLTIDTACGIAAGKTLTISTAATGMIVLKDVCLTAFSNSGIVNGAGILRFEATTGDRVMSTTLGTISCPVEMYTAGTSGNRQIMLSADTVFSGSLYIHSGHATSTIRLHHWNNWELTVGGQTILGDRALVLQGIGTFDFADYLQNGISSSFTMGGDVGSDDMTASAGSLVLDNHIWTCSGNWNTVGTSFSPSTSTVIMDGVGMTITTSALQTFYVLMVGVGASITLASSIIVTDWLRMDGILIIATFTVDNTGGLTTTPNDFAFATAGTFIAGTAVRVSGDWDSTAFTFVQGSSLVTLDGVGKTITMVPGQTFSFLECTGTISQLSAFSVSNDWIVSAGVFTGNAMMISVGRNVDTVAGVLTPSTVNLTMNGNGILDVDDRLLNITIDSMGGVITQTATPLMTDDFYMVVGTFQMGADIAVIHDFQMVGGSFLASADTVFFGGNWTSVGGFSPSTGTVIYNGTGAGNVSISSTEAFYGFEVNGTGTVISILTLLSDITAHNVSVRSGTLKISTFTMNIIQDLIDTNNGWIDSGFGAKIIVYGNVSFNIGIGGTPDIQLGDSNEFRCSGWMNLTSADFEMGVNCNFSLNGVLYVYASVIGSSTFALTSMASGGFAQINSTVYVIGNSVFGIGCNFHFLSDFDCSGILWGWIIIGTASSITGKIDGELRGSGTFQLFLGDGTDDIFYINGINWTGNQGVSTDAIIYCNGDLYISVCDFNFQTSTLFIEGNWNTIGVGTWTSTGSDVTMTLDGSTIQMDNTDYFNILRIEANVAVPIWAGTYDFYVYDTHTMTVDVDFYITHSYFGYGSGTPNGVGSITHYDGSGEIYSEAMIDADYMINNTASVDASSNIWFGKNLTVSDNSEFYVIDFNLRVSGWTLIETAGFLIMQHHNTGVYLIVLERNLMIESDSFVYDGWVWLGGGYTLSIGGNLYLNSTNPDQAGLQLNLASNVYIDGDVMVSGNTRLDICLTVGEFRVNGSWIVQLPIGDVCVFNMYGGIIAVYGDFIINDSSHQNSQYYWGIVTSSTILHVFGDMNITKHNVGFAMLMKWMNTTVDGYFNITEMDWINIWYGSLDVGISFNIDDTTCEMFEINVIVPETVIQQALLFIEGWTWDGNITLLTAWSYLECYTETIRGNINQYGGDVRLYDNIKLYGNLTSFGGYVIGVAGRSLYIWGDWNTSAAVWNGWGYTIRFLRDNTNISVGSSDDWYSLLIDADVTAKTNITLYSSDFYSFVGDTFTIPAGNWFFYNITASSNWNNSGQIIGAGFTEFLFSVNSVDTTIVSGDIDTDLYVYMDTFAPSSMICTLGADWTLGASLIVKSDSAFTMYLDTNDFNTTVGVDVLIDTGGIILGGTGIMTIYGSWNSVNGDFIWENSTVIMADVGRITMTATQGFWNLTILTSHTITLMSDLYVYHYLYIPGMLYQNGFDVFIITDTPYCLVAPGQFDGYVYLRNQTSFYVFVASSMGGWLSFENRTVIDFGGLLTVDPDNCTALIQTNIWKPSTTTGAVVAQWKCMLNIAGRTANISLSRLTPAGEYQVRDPSNVVFSDLSNPAGVIHFLSQSGTFIVTLMSGESYRPDITPPPQNYTILHLSIGLLMMLIAIYGIAIVKRKWLMIVMVMLLIAGLAWCLIYGLFNLIG